MSVWWEATLLHWCSEVNYNVEKLLWKSEIWMTTVCNDHTPPTASMGSLVNIIWRRRQWTLNYRGLYTVQSPVIEPRPQQIPDNILVVFFGKCSLLRIPCNLFPFFNWLWLLFITAGHFKSSCLIWKCEASGPREPSNWHGNAAEVLYWNTEIEKPQMCRIGHRAVVLSQRGVV